MIKTIAALAAASAIVLAAAPAMAEDDLLLPESGTALEQVRVADLNLNDQTDAMRVLRRIRVAARDVCDDRTGRMSLPERVFRTKCVRETTGETVAELGSPTVRELFDVRGR